MPSVGIMDCGTDGGKVWAGGEGVERVGWRSGVGGEVGWGGTRVYGFALF